LIRGEQTPRPEQTPQAALIRKEKTARAAWIRGADPSIAAALRAPEWLPRTVASASFAPKF